MTPLIWIFCGFVGLGLWVLTCFIITSGLIMTDRTFMQSVQNATVKDLLMAMLVISCGPISVIVFTVTVLLVAGVLLSDVFEALMNKKLFRRN